MLTGPVVTSHRTKIINLAAKNRLPAMYYRSDSGEAGGLMTYSVNIDRLVPARRNVCGQDPERREAR